MVADQAPMVVATQQGLRRPGDVAGAQGADLRDHRFTLSVVQVEDPAEGSAVNA